MSPATAGLLPKRTPFLTPGRGARVRCSLASTHSLPQNAGQGKRKSGLGREAQPAREFLLRKGRSVNHPLCGTQKETRKPSWIIRVYWPAAPAAAPIALNWLVGP